MQGMICDDLREELAAIGRFLTQMETNRRRHPAKVLASRLLRIEKKLPPALRRESLIAQAAAMIFDDQLDPLTELIVLRMAWASSVRALAKTYGFQVIEGRRERNSRAA